MTVGATGKAPRTRPRQKLLGRHLVDVSSSRSPELWVADLEAAFGQASPLHQHAPVLDAGRTALDRLRGRLARH
jgi:hypothetical protein